MSDISQIKNSIKGRLDGHFKVPFVKKFKPIIGGSYSSMGNGNGTGNAMMGRMSSTVQSLGFSPIVDRLQRYSEYAVMDYTAELQAGLDIFCLAEDTLVSVVTKQSILEYSVELHTIKELSTLKEPFYVYSCDSVETGRPSLGRCISAHKTGDQALVYKLTLNNGYEIEATKEHKFMLENGKYKELQMLSVGDVLMTVLQYSTQIITTGKMTVKSIKVSRKVDVYDLTIERYHNFAINAGNNNNIIVHNSDDSTTKFLDGDCIHINTQNETVKAELENLYFNVLNLNFNLWGWVRDMLKYGDNMLLLDLELSNGVVGALPLSVYEVERAEDILDTENPVKFILNNQVDRVFSIWEVAHFRMLADRDFYPYGRSILENVRKYWRSLNMMEDSMMIYRLARAPERRVVYIDVGGLQADQVEAYVNDIANTLKNNPIDVDNNGNFDYKLNPQSMLDDYFIPVRGKDSATKIETLKGASNEVDMEDIKYIQKKLVTSLKIPQRYLGLNDDQKGDLKNAAAQEDIRFSRTIERIQSMVIAELKKIGIVHLILKGYMDEDVDGFQLLMKNPSSASEVEKLEVIKEKFGIAADILEGKLADRQWVYENILSFTDDERELIDKGLEGDYEFMSRLNAFSGVWTKKYTQDAEKIYNIQKPQDAMMGGMGGAAGAEEEEPVDVAGEFRAKKIGGDNNVGGKLLAKSAVSTVLRPYESINVSFDKISKGNSALLVENKKRVDDKTENVEDLLKRLMIRNEKIYESIIIDDDN